MFTIEGKPKIVYEWAKTWPVLDEYLKLNTVTNAEDEAAFVTEETDLITGDPFIDGTAPRRFSFVLHIVLPWSDGYDDINVESLKKATTWMDWVNSQFDEGNIPDFGEGVTIEGIETEQNMPLLNVVNPEDSWAEYLFHARINYIE